MPKETLSTEKLEKWRRQDSRLEWQKTSFDIWDLHTEERFHLDRQDALNCLDDTTYIPSVIASVSPKFLALKQPCF